MNITTRITVVSNLKMSAPKQRLQVVHSRSRSRNVKDPTSDCRQSEHLHHQATGAGRAECPPIVQICYSVEWSNVPLCFMLFSSSAWPQFTRFHCHKTFSEILELLFVKCGSLSVSSLSQADITYAIDSICMSWCVMSYLYFVYDFYNK